MKKIQTNKRTLSLSNVSYQQKQPEFQWVINFTNQFKSNIQHPIELRQTIMKNSQLQRCLIHNIIFSIYCTICRKVICASCMYTSMVHRKHRVIPIQNAREQIKQDIRGFQDKIPKLIQHCNSITSNNSQALVKMQKQYAPIVMRVQDFYEQLRQFIKSKQKQQLDYLKQKRQLYRQQIAVYNRQLSRISQYISQKYKSYANDNLKSQMLIPSRNILQTLLSCNMIVNQNLFDLQKIKFTIDAQKISLAQDQIKYKITNIISIFQEDYTNKNLKKNILSKQIEPILPNKNKNVVWKSLQKIQKKRLNSSIFGGAHTTRKKNR